MKLGNVTIREATTVLTFILVASAVAGSILIWAELQRGGMGAKWVYSTTDAYGNKNRYMAAQILDDGSILAYESTSFQGYLIHLDTNGTLEWRAPPINAFPWPVHGPNGGWYYIDWSNRDATNTGWRNLTVLDSQGHFRWNYVVNNGSLDLWGIYPDGQVIMHYLANHYNLSTQKTITDVDKIIALTDNGAVLWSMDWPLPDTGENARVADNGTLLVNIRNATGTYEMGISKDGTHVYVEKVGYFVGFVQPSSSRNGTTEYEVLREFVDNQTTVISVYAINLSSGENVWRTILHYSDNSENQSSGVSFLGPTVVDGKGRIYCGDLESKYSYCLDGSGAILWKRPYLGAMLGVFPSGGILVSNPSSIKEINPDGSLAWRHAVRLNGYSSVWLGPDDTVYYFTDTSIVALAHTTGLSSNVLLLLIVMAIDGVAVSSYLLLGWRRRRAPQA